ncbi:MAG TPA: LysR substrate-binding domain-containing protein [Usitatibacter sp.]|nr:LysR substrate-binding domain-containing protein [Usitatibacter sp.]
MLNLRSVDLNLLPVFEAAYEARSLSKAAIRLAMTQPAVSHALSRLRAAFRDELFIRHSRGMTPTPAADAIYSRLGEALGLVRAAVTESRGFDAETSERRFAIAIPHPLGPTLALKVMERIASRAPKITLSFNTRSRPVELERGLREGRFDLLVDWLPALGEALAAEPLFEDELVAVARRGHPAIRRARSRKALLEWKFVTLRPRMDVHEHPLEGVREWMRLGPTLALEVSEFLEVLAVVQQSELIGLVPRSLVNAARSILAVQAIPGVPGGTPFPVRMSWRARRSSDPAHEFLRDQVRTAARQVAKA